MGIAVGAGALAALSLLSTALPALVGGGGGGDGPSVTPPPVPEGKATQPDLTNFAKQRSTAPLPTPEGITFGKGLQPDQQRAQIATQGVAGESGLYRTPQVKEFYKDLAIRTLTDESGAATRDPLPIERQFARDVFAVQPRTPSRESFLSALLRS